MTAECRALSPDHVGPACTCRSAESCALGFGKDEKPFVRQLSRDDFETCFLTNRDPGDETNYDHSDKDEVYVGLGDFDGS
jgi:hypothetical protein